MYIYSDALDFFNALNANGTVSDSILPSQMVFPSGLVPFKYPKFKGLVFNNFIASGAEIRDTFFVGCIFTKCKLNGTRFIGCQFVDCKFIDCEIYKIVFSSTYIDCDSFMFSSMTVDRSNIYVHLYHQIFRSNNELSQPFWANKADYLFRYWQKEQVDRELRKAGLHPTDIFFRTLLTNISYLFGFGIKLNVLVRTSLMFYAICFFINWVSWPVAKYSNFPEGQSEYPSFFTCFNFTFHIFTSYGDVDVFPTTDWMLFLLNAESIIGFVITGFLLASIIKRVQR